MKDSRSLGVIDVHSHIIPDQFPDGAGRDARWPSVVHGQDGSAQVVIEGKLFRQIDHRSWNAEARIADMEARGIGHQILSPMPELLSYWFDGNSAAAICESVNSFLAGLVSAYPARFSAFGMVPLQTPERAARDLTRLRDMGLAGIEIGTHIQGTPLGDPSLVPFFAEAERLSMTIMVHALHPVGGERIGSIPTMDPTAVFPLETALAAVSLMTGGVLEKHPDLRIILCHGGGALPAILPRLDHAYRLGMPIRNCMSVPPSKLARQFYFDSIVYGDAALQFLEAAVGADRILTGTDYPFLIMENDPVGFIRHTLSEDAASKILYRSLASLFGHDSY
tara:strand:+ start:22668 stop:23675 length:1008 start_codon:yes stop_codon:yes gene_type:complete